MDFLKYSKFSKKNSKPKWEEFIRTKSCDIAIYISMKNFSTLGLIIKNFGIFVEGSLNSLIDNIDNFMSSKGTINSIRHKMIMDQYQIFVNVNGNSDTTNTIDTLIYYILV